MKRDFFYIVGCSQTPDGGIYLFRGGRDGLPVRDGFSAAPGANYLAVSPDGGTLYVSGNDARRAGYVAAFRVHSDGGLSPLNRVDTNGLSCCHLCVSPDGRRLYAANYLSGSVTGFRLDPEGSIGAPEEFDQHCGRGVNPERQERAHAHYTGFSPDGRFLLVNDLGLDTVFCYPYTPERGLDIAGVIPNLISPAGSGPRHLLFEPGGESLILLNEMGNSIQRLRFDRGRLYLTSSASTLPGPVDAPTKAAAVRFSPDGRFVLATNRGFDSIAVFERTTLRMVSLTCSGGVSPRDLNFLPDARTVAAANEFSGKVVFFDFDAKCGALTPTGRELHFPRPLCVFHF